MQWNQRYRPQSFEDIFLADVRTHIQAVLASPSFPQVWLCSGPKGTGKTSTARILAAVVNDPANAAVLEDKLAAKKTKRHFANPDTTNDLVKRIFAGTALCLQELDAASNRGIDDVRQLKEAIYLSPQEGRMRVIILDEVHMLTNEAFNALLKLLEEPPKHVLFVLATTEPEKLPATVRSRAVQIRFRKATISELVAAAERILKAESIAYELDDLQTIAAISDGSFRDMVKIVQLSTKDDAVRLTDRLVGTASLMQSADSLVRSIIAKDPKTVQELFTQLRSKHQSLDHFRAIFLARLHATATQADEQIEGVTGRQAIFLLKYFLDPLATVDSPLLGIGFETLSLDIIARAQQQ